MGPFEHQQSKVGHRESFPPKSMNFPQAFPIVLCRLVVKSALPVALPVTLHKTILHGPMWSIFTTKYAFSYCVACSLHTLCSLQPDNQPAKHSLQSVCTTHHTIGKYILCGGPCSIALCSVACTLTTNLQSTTQLHKQTVRTNFSELEQLCIYVMRTEAVALSPRMATLFYLGLTACSR